MAGDDHGSWLTLAMIIFLTWSILFYWVRLWAKLRVKTVGADDWAVTCALAISIVHQGLMYTAINKGYGKKSELLSTDTLDAVSKYIYAGHFFYIIPVGVSKVASAFFVEQVAHHGPHSGPARIMAWVSGAWTIASLLVVAIRPPYLSPWLAMDGQATMFSRWVGVEATGLVVEVALWGLATHLVWSLQMQQNRRVFIVGAFGFRLLLIAIVAGRLYFLDPRRNGDVNHSSIIAAIFTSGALQFSILATSVTALKPFLTVFNQPMYTVGSAGLAGRSADSGDPYYKLEMFRRVDRNVEISDDSANWRPDHGSAQRSITAEPGKVFVRQKKNEGSVDRSRPYTGSANRPPRAALSSADDAASAQTDASDRMIIQKTTEVMVRYEDSKPNKR
ncbi:hypothetical protein NLG97_g4000 [Lecanicillium saksenae]|uniref:Uncharacterized protein n=1 Tax=Lecanicillium saksenae TaxID=468837 RepID=A0ACC1QZU2_9HYPO|nr:hypothetical protein NLG97_g4000 [Lecanicillium saksenae]